MSKYLFSLAVAFAGCCLSGCQSTPGFTASVGITVPPTLRSTSALAPVPTAMGTTYAIEGNNDVPVIQRQLQVAPVPVQRRLMPAIAPEQLPMPKQSLPPCGSAGTISGTNAAAE